MKKLLTLLGSFALIASSAAITVACKTPSQEIKADESDKAKKGETKEEKKVEPVVTTTTAAKKEVKAKSDAEIASELTRELFLLMDDSKSKSKENKPTSSPEDILKRQEENASRSVSVSRAPRSVNNENDSSLVSSWLKGING
ncbi:lipoprotein [Mycoplasma mycoides]|uniref:lipoprotein n=1 Tax=Mycoplasma mycoides TaxID=2102 RepID=UPI0001793FE1|nr:lipoprotein [Mycoplasma mycoides]SRX58699.1 cell wall anchoring protein [Mycoplasma mycoides subsp. capri]SRX61278.1 cell wall anchoring protein [Mycoplasma mycoides subsp. capri]SRX61428.1 cell wall anchoring protein [Mycoplasma mycoides subsp. capri]SRX63050.1 cell wall anchoring protein [Mycoplasma mycoides subsp. capri]SRX63663.1 cell wall anchoring protein [Mycoplasma mycoides subsp. capri]